jgi:hypothetical protein
MNIGRYYNAHHTAWGSTDCNRRGVALVEFIVNSSLDILYQGNKPTFSNGYSSGVIKITLWSIVFLENIESWDV